MKTIDPYDYWTKSPEERAKIPARRVWCGPDCPCDTPKTGISIGKFDQFGTPYPDAIGVMLAPGGQEWVVTALGDDGSVKEVGRHMVADVEAIRYLPNETRSYSHWVIDE